jgi:hypothetical protein
MTAWSGDELSKLQDAEELEIASVRRDGRQRNPVTIWVVRHGDNVYVRSVNGREGSWFRGAQDRHEAHVEAGGVEKDVRLIETDEADDEIGAAYRAKYHQYAPRIVNSVLTSKARAATLKLVPRS